MGQTVTAIINGQTYEGIIEQHNTYYLKLVVGPITIIGFTSNGVCNIKNNTGSSGTFSATVMNKVYSKIDHHYLPIPAVEGTGLNSIVLNESGSAAGRFATSTNSSAASGDNSFSANNGSANGDRSFAINCGAKANGMGSFAMGWATTASGEFQCVEGQINIEDTENKYIHIAGNGTRGMTDDIPSNAYTLDWSGNAWFAGSVEGTSVILSSPNGSRFNITVNDDGQL